MACDTHSSRKAVAAKSGDNAKTATPPSSLWPDEEREPTEPQNDMCNGIIALDMESVVSSLCLAANGGEAANSSGGGGLYDPTWPQRGSTAPIFASPRRSMSNICSPDEQDLNRTAARCELKRLLKTAGTDDKKRKVTLALDRLQGSCRGTALSIIINDAFATTSATVAAAAVSARRDTVGGHERANTPGKLGKRGSLYGQSCRVSLDETRPLEIAKSAAIENMQAIGRDEEAALPYPIKPTTLQVGAGSICEAWPADSRLDSARRFTVPLLPSIPEHRITGRRVHVNQGPVGREKERIRRADGMPRNNRSGSCDTDTSSDRSACGLDSPVTVRQCGGQVAEVPQALFGKATSTGVDPLHPPSAAVDGMLGSFWVSTGLFPQTLTILLRKPVVVYEVAVACGGVDAAFVQLGSFGNDFCDSVGDQRTAGRKHSSRRQRKNIELERMQDHPRHDSGDTNYQAAGGTGNETMIFRVPGGVKQKRTDRISLVVRSGRSPFCTVTAMTVRGQLGGSAVEAVD